mgnify:CR=1 FL=1
MDDLIIVDCQYDFIDGTLRRMVLSKIMAASGRFIAWPAPKGRRWIPLLHGISSGRPIVHRRTISSSKVCGMMSKNTLLSMG